MILLLMYEVQQNISTSIRFDLELKSNKLFSYNGESGNDQKSWGMFDSMRHNQATPAFNGSIILLTARDSVILVNTVEPGIELGNLEDSYEIDFVRLKGKNCPSLSPSFFIGGTYRAENGEV